MTWVKWKDGIYFWLVFLFKFAFTNISETTCSLLQCQSHSEYVFSYNIYVNHIQHKNRLVQSRLRFRVKSFPWLYFPIFCLDSFYALNLARFEISAFRFLTPFIACFIYFSFFNGAIVLFKLWCPEYNSSRQLDFPTIL